MGVQGLKKFLREYGLVKQKSLFDFSDKKIAIDISSFLYKYKITRGELWQESYIHLITNLRKCDIHCIFIFDGKPPIDKQLEKEKRKEVKDNLENLVFNLELDLQNYIKEETVSDLLKTTNDTLNTRDNEKINRLLRKTKYIDVKKIQEYIDKKKSQSITISNQDIIQAKTILDLFDINYIQAPSEAESLCAYLCEINKCVGVITEDTDILTYGTKIYISNINTGTHTCDVVYLDEVLKSLELTHKEFIDFCIMCKVDYNKNIPKIGIKNAFKLITEYRSIDKLIPYFINKNIDYSMLRYLRCRDIFYTFNNLVCRTCKNIFPNYNIKSSIYPPPYCKSCKDNIDIEFNKEITGLKKIKIQKCKNTKIIFQTKYWNINLNLNNIIEYLIKNNIKFNKEEMLLSWKPVEIKFV